MKPKVYLETTIPSYLTSNPSRDIVVAGHQQTTHDWWNKRRNDFELYVSQVVVDEISLGDVAMVIKRLSAVKNIPLLGIDTRVLEMSDQLIKNGVIPRVARADAVHISIAALHEMDYLLTWNCKHIANPKIQRKLESVFDGAGYTVPLIYTPEQLL